MAHALRSPHSPIGVALLIPLALWVTFLAYEPGLSGPFLLDDHRHLPKLAGEDGQVDTLREIYQLVFSGERLFGRQLSYLSLLINDNAWPASPDGFKRFNLLIHLLNGLLVFFLARILARLSLRGMSAAAVDWAALVTMALWLFHPFQLSPVLFVIQRMTLLAGTFSLLAVLAYLHGRELAVMRPRAGYLWMTLGFGLSLVLGIFCKETAIMTICYVIVLEATLLTAWGPPRPVLWRAWATFVLGIPLLGVSAYFLAIQPQVEQLLITRDFTLVERLMTEARVLFLYLYGIVIPSATVPFHDDVIVSRTLLDPPTTLLSIVLIGCLIGLAVWQRRRYPVIAFAVLWFFAGHLLESTILPLELYFEHRNYLPMLGFAVAVGHLVILQSKKFSYMAHVGIIAFLALSISITFSSARVWGDQTRHALVWANDRPESVRAQLMAIQFWERMGIGESLHKQCHIAEEAIPKSASLPLLCFIIDRCWNDGPPPIGGSIVKLNASLPNARFEYGNLEGIDWVVVNRVKEDCRISHSDVVSIIELYLANPLYFDHRQSREALFLMLANVYKQKGDLNATILALDSAYEARPGFLVPLKQAWYLATAGLFDDARDFLDLAKAAPARSVWEFLWRDDRISEMEVRIENLKQTY